MRAATDQLSPGWRAVISADERTAIHADRSRSDSPGVFGRGSHPSGCPEDEALGGKFCQGVANRRIHILLITVNDLRIDLPGVLNPVAAVARICVINRAGMEHAD